MVKKILLIFIVILLSVSCDFIQSTPFGLGESLLLNSQSIDSYIPNIVEHYQLNILDNGNKEYLFLYMEYGYGSAGRKVVILDEYLKVKEYYDDDDITIELGKLNMVDVNGNFVVGRTVFNEDLSFKENIAVNENITFFGFADDYTGAGFNFTFNMTGNLMYYDTFNPDWTIAANGSFPVGPASNYYLIKTTYDHNRSLISFIFSDSEYNNTNYYSIFTINDFFPGALGVTVLLDHSSTVSFSNLDSDSISYTEDGIAGIYQDYELKLISLMSGSTIDEYEDWEREDLVYAYDLKGKYFYFLDTNNNSIYKYYTWW